MNLFRFVLSNSDLWLLGAAGVCVAWLVPHWLAVSRQSREAFRSASIAFRAAFNDSLVRLKTESSEDPAVFLQQSFGAHEIAVSEFLGYLSWWQRQRFVKAWQEYHCNELDNTMHNLAQYTRGNWTNNADRTHGRQIPIKRIEHLLSFAKAT